MDSVTQRLSAALLCILFSSATDANLLTPADRDTIQQQQRELLDQNQQQQADQRYAGHQP